MAVIRYVLCVYICVWVYIYKYRLCVQTTFILYFIWAKINGELDFLSFFFFFVHVIQFSYTEIDKCFQFLEIYSEWGREMTENHVHNYQAILIVQYWQASMEIWSFILPIC